MTDHPLPAFAKHSKSSAKRLRYNITDIRCTLSPRPGLICRALGSRFYVKASVDGKTKETSLSHASSNGTWSWNESVYFDIEGDSIPKLCLYRRHRLHKDEYIGETEFHTSEISCHEVISRKLRQFPRDTLKKTVYAIEFTVERVDVSSSTTHTESTQSKNDTIDDAKHSDLGTVDERIKAAGEASRKMQQGPLVPSKVSNVVDLGESVADSSAAQTLESLLEKLTILMPIVDGITKIHPYVQVAYSVLFVIPKTILAQVDRDAKIQNLVETMNDTFLFVHDANPLREGSAEQSSLLVIIAKMIQQITECTYFICAYSDDLGFGKRMMKNMLSNTDEKIEEFRRTLEQLKVDFQSAVTVDSATRIVHLKILAESIGEKVDYIAEGVDLKDMPYATGAGHQVERCCLPHTRQKILDEIVNWVNTPNRDSVERVLWLSGLAGMGKSTIAHTVADIFSVHQRLGTFFAFSLANQTDRRPGNLFSTIAINLCSLDPEWKHSLWKVVKDKPALRSTPSIHTQFTDFLLSPIKASNISLIGPIIIIIDALDEAGNAESREGILSILGKRVMALPSNFRIIVTSRPEEDIRIALDGKPHIKHIQMETIDSSDTTADLNLFVMSQLSKLPRVAVSLETHWPNKEWCSLLVAKSEGLFQWAATACRIVNGDGKRAGSTPAERFKGILGVASNLDSLYLDILQKTFDIADITAMERFRGVMGVLLQSKEPLSISSLSELCSQDSEYTPDILASVLAPLSSLLAGVDRQLDPIRLLHTSFRDFLNKNKFSDADNPFYVDSSGANKDFTVRCLRFMKELRFNICEVKTSHLCNAYPDRTQKNIPFYLSYSCRYWAVHLKVTHCDAYIIDLVHETLYLRFLYWLEVLSLIKSFKGASELLSFVRAWGTNPVGDGLIKTTERLQEILAFIEDAVQFVGAFGTPIFQSAPHIYISALPLAPTSSIISKTFLPWFRNNLTSATRESQHWPACQNVLKVSADETSVEVIGLPDGKRFIVSIVGSQTIWIWDADTFSILEELDHSPNIESLAVSQDCKHIVSVNKNEICVLNLESMTVEFRYELASRYKSRTVAISLDGTRIALATNCHARPGFDRSEIIIWDPRTGNAVPGLFRTSNEFISSIVFSSDHSKLYSEAWRDGRSVVRVWDVGTGSSELLKPEGYNGHMPSILALSPDGRCLAFCLDDSQIVIYNIEDRNSHLGPFGDHDGDIVRHLEFSQDGQRIVSDASGKFRVWNACTGCMIAGPFERIGVYSRLAFLSANRIISGSWDGNIRIWNIANGVSIEEPYDRHSDRGILSVEFSSSGDYILSSGLDETVRLWNAKTGGTCWTRSEMGRPTFASFSADDEHIVSASRNVHDLSVIRIWSIADSSLQPIEIQLSPIDMLSTNVKPRFSRNAKFVTAFLRSHSDQSESYTLGIWDASTGSPASGSLKYTRTPESTITDFWDGDFFAAHDGNIAYIYDTEKGLVTTKTFGLEGYVWTMTLSQDHRYLAAHTRHHPSLTISIWDMQTGIDIGTLPVDTWILCLTFSPDNRFLVLGSSDGRLLVWEVRSDFAAKPLSLKGHIGRVESVAFSPDSRYIVSGGEDGMIYIWDVSDLGDENGEKVTAAGLPEFQDDSDLVDGWARGPEGELLFWVPPWNRQGLYRPRNTLVIGKGANKLDFTRFVHGEDWYKCYTGASE